MGFLGCLPELLGVVAGRRGPRQGRGLGWLGVVALVAMGGRERPAVRAVADALDRRAGEVDHGNQQPEVLPDAHQTTHAGAPPIVAAAQQVDQLGFHPRTGRAVVRPPDGIPLPVAARASSASWVDADGAPGAAAGGLGAQQAHGAGAAEAGQPVTTTARDDRHGEPGGQVTVPADRSMASRS